MEAILKVESVNDTNFSLFVYLWMDWWVPHELAQLPESLEVNAVLLKIFIDRYFIKIVIYVVSIINYMLKCIFWPLLFFKRITEIQKSIYYNFILAAVQLNSQIKRSMHEFDSQWFCTLWMISSVYSFQAVEKLQIFSGIYCIFWFDDVLIDEGYDIIYV